MYGSSILLECLIASPQTALKSIGRNMEFKDALKYEVRHNNQGQVEEIIKENIDYIENKIIIPILESNINELDSTFKEQLFPFTLKLNALNMALIKILSQQQDNSSSILIDFEYSIFKEIIDFIESESTNNIEIRARLISNIEKLRNYEISMIDFISNNEKIMPSILNDINIIELRRYVSGSMLAFSCITYYLKKNINEEQKLLKLLEHFESNLETLSLFSDSLEILMENSGHSIPIENNVGFNKQFGFHVNLNKMEIGKKYIINYETTQYVVEKNENLDLSIYEVV